MHNYTIKKKEYTDFTRMNKWYRLNSNKQIQNNITNSKRLSQIFFFK